MCDYGVLGMTTTVLQRKLCLANLPVLSAERQTSATVTGLVRSKTLQTCHGIRGRVLWIGN